jgi:hypothetical protein
MSRDAIALVVGTALAILGLAFVLYPLFVEPRTARRERVAPSESAGDRDRAVDALREIEFDRETGKLSDVDYTELKATYTQEAIAAMRAEESATVIADPDTDPAEAAVLRYRQRARACAACGPRPELDAVYCSSCGSYLPGRCGTCGTAVTVAGATFCSGCGQALAA